jgi:hypothetical protein
MRTTICAPMGSSSHACETPCADDDGNEVRPLFSMRPFDFEGLQSGGKAMVAMSDDIDVSAYDEAHLRVLVDRAQITGDAKIEIVLLASEPSRHDPGRRFRTELATIALEGPLDVSPEGDGLLRGAAVPEGLGSSVAVEVRGEQGSTPEDCTAVLSAEVVLRRRPRELGGGRRVIALPLSELDYSELAPSGTESAVLVRALSVVADRTGQIVLRTHAREIGTGSKIDVSIYSVFPDPMDPAVDFTRAEPEAELEIDPSSPDLQVVRLPPGFGPALLVHIEATKSSGGGDLEATISLDYVGQE